MNIKPQSLVARMQKIDDEPFRVSGKEGLWVSAKQLRMVARWVRGKTSKVCVGVNGYYAVPTMRAAITLMYIDTYTKRKLVALWWAVRRKSQTNWGWGVFLTNILHDMCQDVWDKFMKGELDWSKWKKKALRTRENRKLPKRNWPRPMSVPDWLLPEEHRD